MMIVFSPRSFIIRKTEIQAYEKYYARAYKYLIFHPTVIEERPRFINYIKRN